MGRDARNAKRAAQAYLAREATQRCTVCGKRFAMRAERGLLNQLASRKLKEQARQQKVKEYHKDRSRPPF